MFAGPNGSGKSTLKSVLKPEWLGLYLNADELDEALRATNGWRPPSGFPPINPEGLGSFLDSSERLSDGRPGSERIEFMPDGNLRCRSEEKGGYLAAVLADYLRQELLSARLSFTFETVMSHPSKVELLRQAKAAGYRTYLYFIATEDPQVNIDRIATRVALGGHPVPSG